MKLTQRQTYRIIRLLFIFSCILLNVTVCDAQKTSTYYKYQENNSFKGIKFGSSYAEVFKILSLQPTAYKTLFVIRNIEYLEYDVLKFESAVAYFNKQGQLYQIVLKVSPSSPIYQKYNRFKQSLINLFGTSDNEYTYEPKENFFQPLSISWGKKGGDNVGISLSVSEETKNTTGVTLMIYNNKLNNESNKDIIESSNVIGVPKI